MENIKDILINLTYLIASFLFIFGIKRMSSPATAKNGNLISGIGMLLAIVVTLMDRHIISYELIFAGLVIGSAIGAVLAYKVQMTAMPQMVGLLNGFGGGASALVGMAEYYHTSLLGFPDDGGKFLVSVGLSLLIGAVTFTGSLIAFGKLQGLVTGKVVKIPGQNVVVILLILAIFTLIGLGISQPHNLLFFEWVVGLSLLLGILLVMPIGGADMPVAISLLNSYSGIAGSATGFVIDNNMLIIAGALVGASGIILTNIMCKAMNRSIMNVLLGGWANVADTGAGDASAVEKVVKSVDTEEAAMLFSGASKVMIVPGYGMAVSQAQHAVKELMNVLEKNGTEVRFAIHPVAGRMPGHMNILLAESNVPYDKLFPLDEINDDFKNVDISLVIGANDVVNPAARNNPQSTIYGMPILNVDYSKTVIVVKRSMNAGYAGIENDLFYMDNTLMYFGDAKDAISKLVNELKAMNS